MQSHSREKFFFCHRRRVSHRDRIDSEEMEKNWTSKKGNSLTISLDYLPRSRSFDLLCPRVVRVVHATSMDSFREIDTNVAPLSLFRETISSIDTSSQPPFELGSFSSQPIVAMVDVKNFVCHGECIVELCNECSNRQRGSFSCNKIVNVNFDAQVDSVGTWSDVRWLGVLTRYIYFEYLVLIGITMTRGFVREGVPDTFGLKFGRDGIIRIIIIIILSSKRQIKTIHGCTTVELIRDLSKYQWSLEIENVA